MMVNQGKKNIYSNQEHQAWIPLDPEIITNHEGGKIVIQILDKKGSFLILCFMGLFGSIFLHMATPGANYGFDIV
jgi:hypothetical protein